MYGEKSPLVPRRFLSARPDQAYPLCKKKKKERKKDFLPRKFSSQSQREDYGTRTERKSKGVTRLKSCRRDDLEAGAHGNRHLTVTTLTG
ncbi:hypothetical protein WN55_03376 [Dufourea novaeangliae]|uniref:Uncharacterized protein n=1 Tax=Dufourea novaeangliae TaxID=178035 RepID=A0A154PLB3_DUFNO|nr:hypothetical protein WN55_03376 [Dufourea novaeangliae]